MATSCNKIGNFPVLTEKCIKPTLYFVSLKWSIYKCALEQKPYPLKIKHLFFLLQILVNIYTHSQAPDMEIIKFFSDKIVHCTDYNSLGLGHKLIKKLLFEPETQWNTSCPVLHRPQQFSQTLLLAVSS